MFQASTPGAEDPLFLMRCHLWRPQPLSRDRPHPMKPLVGSARAVQHTIKLLYKLNDAEPNDWSKPIPTGQATQVVMA